MSLEKRPTITPSPRGFRLDTASNYRTHNKSLVDAGERPKDEDDLAEDEFDLEQARINRREWSTSDNWSGPKLFPIYFSKKDDRTWVPKPHPSKFSTLNLGTESGILLLLGILVGIPLFVILLVVIVFCSAS